MLINGIKREPAVVIGILAACILAVVQTLAGQGVVTPDIAATVTGFFDNASTLDVPLDGWGMPIVLGVVTRFFVYSPPTVRQVAATAARTGDPTVTVTPP